MNIDALNMRRLAAVRLKLAIAPDGCVWNRMVLATVGTGVKILVESQLSVIVSNGDFGLVTAHVRRIQGATWPVLASAMPRQRYPV
jgi:hypothetical protein